MLSDTDRREITDLFATYAHAVDRRDFALLADVFTPDGRLDTGHAVRDGIDEIQEVMEGLHRYEATFHLLGQSRLGGGPDTATGETYCDAHHLMVDRVDGAEVRTDTVMKIRYVDELSRTGDGWRIAVRRLHVDWIADHRLG